MLNDILKEKECLELKGIKSIEGAIDIIKIVLEENQEIVPTCIAIGSKGNVAFPVPLFNPSVNHIIYEFIKESKPKLEEEVGELQEFAFLAEAYAPFEEKSLKETA